MLRCSIYVSSATPAVTAASVNAEENRHGCQDAGLQHDDERHDGRVSGRHDRDAGCLQDPGRVGRQDVEGRPRGRREIDRDFLEMDEGHDRQDRRRHQCQGRRERLQQGDDGFRLRPGRDVVGIDGRLCRDRQESSDGIGRADALGRQEHVGRRERRREEGDRRHDLCRQEGDHEVSVLHPRTPPCRDGQTGGPRAAFLFCTCRKAALSIVVSGTLGPLHRRTGEVFLAKPSDPLLIKRYASRRLYNTEASDYVTLEDIARFIREGREVQIIDLKTGDDLTRQYLLQIIAEHERRGESVLPIDVLTDLVRSYTSQAQSVVPQFLAMSFDMLRDSQSKMVEQMTSPMSGVPAFEAMKAQQAAFLNAVTGGMANWKSPDGDEEKDEGSESPKELEEIRAQLAAMQEQLQKMKK